MVRPIHPDRQLLLIVLQKAEPLLGQMVEEIAATSAIPIESSRRASAAWQEVRVRIAALRLWLKKDSDAFRQLKEVGLAGAQLDFKVHCFDQAYAAYMSASPTTRLIRARVRRALGTILGSLALAAPGAVSVSAFLGSLGGLLEDTPR
jgi:hypothetical protein